MQEHCGSKTFDSVVGCVGDNDCETNYGGPGCQGKRNHITILCVNFITILWVNFISTLCVKIVIRYVDYRV